MGSRLLLLSDVNLTLPETNMETPQKGPVKTTVPLKRHYVGFHVNETTFTRELLIKRLREMKEIPTNQTVFMADMLHIRFLTLSHNC